MHNPAALPARIFHGRVTAVRDVLPDVRILSAELDNRQLLPHLAGQYAQISFDGLPPRAFSIASAPGAAQLEFHVGHKNDTPWTKSLRALSPGSALSIEAPFGNSYWRGGDRPAILLAGGLGIAALKPMIESHLAQNRQTPLHLYWGVRDTGQLYLNDGLRALALRHGHFSYIPVLSDSDDSRYRQGTTAEAALADHGEFSGFEVYMAGPPAMVESALPLLLHHGADRAHIHSDGLS